MTNQFYYLAPVLLVDGEVKSVAAEVRPHVDDPLDASVLSVQTKDGDWIDLTEFYPGESIWARVNRLRDEAPDIFKLLALSEPYGGN